MSYFLTIPPCVKGTTWVILFVAHFIGTPLVSRLFVSLRRHMFVIVVLLVESFRLTKVVTTLARALFTLFVVTFGPFAEPIYVSLLGMVTIAGVFPSISIIRPLSVHWTVLLTSLVLILPMASLARKVNLFMRGARIILVG